MLLVDFPDRIGQAAFSKLPVGSLQRFTDSFTPILTIYVEGAPAPTGSNFTPARTEVLARFEVTAIRVKLVISFHVFTLPRVGCADSELRWFVFRRRVPRR